MEDPLSMLHDALGHHGLESVKQSNRISIEGGRLEFIADTFKHETSDDSVTLSLEVTASSPLLEGRSIVETFASNAATEDRALADTFYKFLLGSFHVLIEALTSHQCDEVQAELEHWTNRETTWDAYSGPLLTQSPSASTLAPAYPEFMAELTTLFLSQASRGPHWIRVFLASYHGRVQATEVLLDNEPWEEAHALLASRDWQCTEDYQSLRHFLLVLPTRHDPVEP
jgi:hypothetical protein